MELDNKLQQPALIVDYLTVFIENLNDCFRPKPGGQQVDLMQSLK